MTNSNYMQIVSNHIILHTIRYNFTTNKFLKRIRKRPLKLYKSIKQVKIGQHGRPVLLATVPPQPRVDPTHVVTLHFQITMDGHDHN